MTFHEIHEPRGRRSPIVFSNVHSGKLGLNPGELPIAFNYACRAEDLMHLHDPHIEKLLVNIPNTGAPVLEGLVHRTCIDLNRAETEVDPASIKGVWPYPTKRTNYTDMKIGLFPVMTGPVWNRTTPIYSDDNPLTNADARMRVILYYRPYYQAMQTLMTRAAADHGQAMLIDIHSYYRQPGSGDRPDIIIGDLNGTSCSPVLTQAANRVFTNQGLRVGFNHPSGRAVITAAANADLGYHSMQIEIARDLYMDQNTFQYDSKKAARIRTALNTLSIEMAKTFTRSFTP